MYFDFANLINKYITSFKVIAEISGDYDDNGEYLYTKTEKNFTGAIIGIDEGKLYRSAGTLTDKDKYLFMFEPLSLQDTKIIYKDEVYNIESQLENAEFTGVYQYTLKYVSAFNKEAECGRK
jgi:hypothetical protein